MSIEALMAETNAEMSGEPSESPSLKSESGRSRVNSIMNMDYDSDDEETADPEDTGIKKGDAIPKVEKKEEQREEKEPAKEEEKEEKEEKEEEPKKEGPEKKLVKYKVDGQEFEEEVTEQDLINSYSGQKALQKRFTEFDKTKKEFEKEKERVVANHNYVLDEVGQVEDGFKQIVKEFNELGYTKSDPVGVVYNLLDKMNIDPASYEKALFFHMIPQVHSFLEMSDEGRDAFLLKKENEWFHKKQHKLVEGQRANSEQKKRLEEENSIKQRYGVSEERFSELREELVEKFGINPKDLSTEKVIGWSLEKPAFDRASALVEKAGGDQKTAFKVAKLLLDHPQTTDDEILNAFGYKDKQAEELKVKLAGKIPPKAAPKKNVYDDVDEDFNKRFRRR